MGLLEFSKLPVNTLVGADWKTFKTVTKGQHIADNKKTKFILTKAICRILSVCIPLQERKYKKLLANKPLENDPLFILGHWRSGTTFVHNIFAQDKHFGYTTTYQTVFPHYMMALQGLFKANSSSCGRSGASSMLSVGRLSGISHPIVGLNNPCRAII